PILRVGDPRDLADLHARDPHRRVRADVVRRREDGRDREVVAERDRLGEAEPEHDGRDRERQHADAERARPPLALAAPAPHGLPPFGTSTPWPPGASVKVSPSGTRVGPRPTPLPLRSSCLKVGPSGPFDGGRATVARRYGSPGTDASRYGLAAMV